MAGASVEFLRELVPTLLRNTFEKTSQFAWFCRGFSRLYVSVEMSDSNANLVLICESLEIYVTFLHDLWFWAMLEQNRWQSSN